MTEKAPPTRRLGCPRMSVVKEGTPDPQQPGRPGPLSVRVAPCIGPQCQLWVAPPDDPQSGNCADVITALSTNVVAEGADKLFEAVRRVEVTAEAAENTAKVAQARAVEAESLLGKAITAMTEAMAKLFPEKK